MTIDNDLDRIAIYLSKLDPHDSFKEALENEYQLYRDIMESIPVDVSPPDRLIASVYSLFQRLKNYVVFGTSNNPLTPIAPSMSELIKSEEKEDLLKEIKTNPTFISNHKQKINILVGYLTNINFDGNIDDIRSTIYLVKSEYSKCKVYSNMLEQEIAKAKYFFIIRLVRDGLLNEADKIAQDFDSDMLLFVHLRHKESVNTLLKENKAFIANEMYHFLNEYQDSRINDIEFWKILTLIEYPDYTCNNEQEENDNPLNEEAQDITESVETSKKKRHFHLFSSKKNESDTFSIAYSSNDYIRINLKLFTDYKMVAKEYWKLIKRVNRITTFNGRDFKEITVTVENYDKVNSYNLDNAVSIKKVLETIYSYFNHNVSDTIFDLDLSRYSLGNIIPERCFEKLLLRRVILPNYVLKIGDRAFFNCKDLREIVLSNNGQLYSIGKEAFRLCESLKQIDLSKQEFYTDILGLELAETGLGAECFAGCTRLEYVSLSDGIEVIPEGCFSGCDLLKKVTLNSFVRIIGKHAFAFCRMLENVQKTDGIRLIEKEAFYCCEKLKDFRFPFYCSDDDELVIEERAFSNSGLKKIYIDCGKLELGEAVFEETNIKKVVFYSGIKSLSERLFNKCYELEEVKLPQFLESIEENCFASCENIKKVELPKTIKRIGKGAFQGCDSLKEINIPTSLEYVGEDAFEDCKSLNKETLKALNLI